ncbi:hypothetical protein F442_01588 [Phytophthora nicotianae P10297]|uniref:Uncharacterized protein n=2 Tax=Phytophthora nicotianae TaxID=4792 RepID=W3A1K6_PHYNI|nr:hypothetical protein F444_01647 [Phytophthora nicotianae P1976]ETP53517.1 hypothetical protein F442_01588 [Phytophthora nicotianae P10297]
MNVNQLKHYRGRWIRPFMDEVPVCLDAEPSNEPLEVSDLPAPI